MFALQDAEMKDKIMRIIKKGKITRKEINQLADVVFNMQPVIALKKKMEKLCERAILLAQELRDRKSKALLTNLAKSMLEDL